MTRSPLARRNVLALTLSVSLTTIWIAAAQQRQGGPPPQIAIDADDIAGVVTSARGPEAGVWVIAETTDTPTKFRKIVVTDAEGRYLLPDLPTKAAFAIWVRGYGLVDSSPIRSAPGRRLALTAMVAPDARAAARVYPANYWYSLALIQPILFKSVIYWACVFVFRIAEGLWHFLLDGGALADFPSFLIAQFSWPRFLAIQIWLMVLFLVYVTAHELNTLFGDGELRRLFLRWHSSEAKLTRRQRIRLLTRLNRLTEANPVEVISEKGSPAHTELVGILRLLATRHGEKETHS